MRGFAYVTLVLAVALAALVLGADRAWSPSNSEPVAQVLASGVLASIALWGLAFAATCIAGAGIAWARERTGGPLRTAIDALSLTGRSVPVLSFALCVEMFAVFHMAGPIGGVASRDGFDLRDRLVHLALPLISLTVPFAGWSALIFTEAFARADYAGRTALQRSGTAVVVTAAAIGPSLAAACVIVETVYAWPGVGRAFYDSLRRDDLPLLAGSLLLYCAGIAFLTGCRLLLNAPSGRPGEAVASAIDRAPRWSASGFCALGALAIAAVGALAASFVPWGPYWIDVAHWVGYPLSPGTAGHVLGTDENGRDLLARLLAGMRNSLLVSLGAAAAALAVAAVVAPRLPAARIELGEAASTGTGIRPFAALPFVLGALTVVYFTAGKIAWNPFLLVALIALASLPATVRRLRSARPRRRWSSLVASAPQIAGGALLLEVTLSHLGFGIQPPNASLGNVLANMQMLVAAAPWVVGVALLVTVSLLAALFALGDDLESAGQPRADAQPAGMRAGGVVGAVCAAIVVTAATGADAQPDARSAPVTISRCSGGITSVELVEIAAYDVTLRNAGPAVADEVRLSVRYGRHEKRATFELKERFPAGVDVSRHVRRTVNGGLFSYQSDQNDCFVDYVHFVNGTSWSRPAR